MNRLDLTRISLPSAFSLAVAQCDKSRDEIAAEMNWSPSQAHRFFSENDQYWPSLPQMPRLCFVLGNSVLIEWMQANICTLGSSAKCSPLDAESYILSMGKMFKEMGELAEAGSDAIADGQISQLEARRILRELLDVGGQVLSMMAQTRAVLEN